MITQKELKEILFYNQENGYFYWKKILGKKNKIGDICNKKNKDGYIRIGINNKRYFAHWLVWLYMYNKMPVKIDHINRIKDDNRVSNLRDTTYLVNVINTGNRKNNKTGVRGISYSEKTKKFYASITKNYKTIYLGGYDNLIDAVIVRVKKELKEGWDKITKTPAMLYLENIKEQEGNKYETNK